MSRPVRPPQEPAADVDCYTVDEFCARNRISRQFFYKLRAQGKGPPEVKLGTRLLIPKEAAREWLRKQQSESGSTGSSAA